MQIYIHGKPCFSQQGTDSSLVEYYPSTQGARVQVQAGSFLHFFLQKNLLLNGLYLQLFSLHMSWIKPKVLLQYTVTFAKTNIAIMVYTISKKNFCHILAVYFTAIKLF